MGANPKMPRRQLLQRLFNVGGGAAAGALSNAHFVEPSLLSITRQTLPMRHLSPSLNGLKAAQLTDLHFRLGSDDALLAETVALTNREAPDLVILTGNYIVRDDIALASMIELLKPLQAEHVILVVLGNHNGWYPGESTVRQQMRRPEFKFLCN